MRFGAKGCAFHFLPIQTVLQDRTAEHPQKRRRATSTDDGETFLRFQVYPQERMSQRLIVNVPVPLTQEDIFVKIRPQEHEFGRRHPKMTAQSVECCRRKAWSNGHTQIVNHGDLRYGCCNLLYNGGHIREMSFFCPGCLRQRNLFSNTFSMFLGQTIATMSLPESARARLVCFVRFVGAKMCSCVRWVVLTTTVVDSRWHGIPTRPPACVAQWS